MHFHIGNESVATKLPTESLPQRDDTGVIVAVFMILIVVITTMVSIVIAVVVVKKRRISKDVSGEIVNGNQATTRNGIGMDMSFLK